jgi:hypothetical protein
LFEAFVLPGAPAWPDDVDGEAVVGESVEDGGGGDVISEVGAPGFPLDVGGDDTGAIGLIAAAITL